MKENQQSFITSPELLQRALKYLSAFLPPQKIEQKKVRLPQAHGFILVEEREIIYTLSAPFTAEKKKLATSAYRFAGIAWSDDHFAIMNERWSRSRKEIRSVINPSDPSQPKKVIIDRSSDDLYNDPGDPLYTENEFGRNVLLRKDDLVFMTSPGGSPEGNMPFISTFRKIVPASFSNSLGRYSRMCQGFRESDIFRLGVVSNAIRPGFKTR